MIMSGFDLPLEQGGAPKELRAKYRALLARAVSEGHELGNHLQFDAMRKAKGVFSARVEPRGVGWVFLVVGDVPVC